MILFYLFVHYFNCLSKCFEQNINYVKIFRYAELLFTLLHYLFTVGVNITTQNLTLAVCLLSRTQVYSKTQYIVLGFDPV